MTYTYPGVYIQELPSPVHTITGVPTSITAFVGYTPRGIDQRAQSIFSFGDFQRLYGGFASDSELSYAVAQFYQNAPGTQAYVVRVPKTGAVKAAVQFGLLTFAALSSGAWANGGLLIDVDQGPPVNLSAAPGGDPLSFNLTITDLVDQTTESFPNVTLDATKMNFVATIINDPNNGSQLVSVTVATASLPVTAAQVAVLVSGVIGEAITVANVTNAVNGGSTATPTTVSGYWGLSLTTTTSSSLSALSSPVTVTVFSDGNPIPQSMSGLAGQVQQVINTTLATAVPGASVQCSVAPSGTGQAIRVNASLPGYPDAMLSFGAPGTPTPPLPSGVTLQDVRATLGLAAPPATNVAHYALGTSNGNDGPPANTDWGSEASSSPGSDGNGLPGANSLVGTLASFWGIYALEKVPVFNLLCIPDATRALPSDPTSLDTSNSADPLNPSYTYSQAVAYCDQRRAFLLVDPPPNVITVSGAIDWISSTLGITDPNGAAFWPRLRLYDPVNDNLRSFAPSGVVAGIYAATDGRRGLWKAPAGITATLSGVQGLTYALTNSENGQLNPLGLNCFRTFPTYGQVLWGARTLQGADALASQWKYVPVRRMASFLELSLYRGLQWVVFEPNDTLLWGAIRLNIESFLQTLFLQGAFQGTTPDQAYFVKCDSETTTQTDIDNGIVNILVGFAPLQPAEFVVIQIEQLTGQALS